MDGEDILDKNSFIFFNPPTIRLTGSRVPLAGWSSARIRCDSGRFSHSRVYNFVAIYYASCKSRTSQFPLVNIISLRVPL